MDWIINLFTNTESIAHIALLYAVVIAVGILLDVCALCRYRGRTHRVYWSDQHLELYSGLRTYSVRVLYRSSGWSWLLREFQKGRRYAQLALYNTCTAERWCNVRMLLHLLRHQRQDKLANDGGHSLWRRDQYSRSWCSQ